MKEKEIKTITKLENHKFIVEYKGSKKKYIVEDNNDDIILTFLIAGIINK